MRNAIVFSTWSWDTFNVPERIALALGIQGARVLHCEIPVSLFRRRGRKLEEIENGVYVFGPEYLGAKLSRFPIVKNLQWKMVAQQILENAERLRLKDPVFIYSHIDRMTPLCQEMRSHGFPLVHICMDYPEPYQYELIEVSDLTLVIPRAVFHKLRAKFGEKIQRIPQSIHLPIATFANSGPHPGAPELGQLPHPRLGYLGPLFDRVNLGLLRNVLVSHPEWQFIYFGDPAGLRLPNMHTAGWRRPAELPEYVGSFDVGVMPYDCFNERNLHCSPLKLFDYFLAGLPVVSTPVIPLWEFSDLIYFGETAAEFSQAICRALEEPATSPKRRLRKDVARAHSTESLGRRMAEVLKFGCE